MKKILLAIALLASSAVFAEGIAPHSWSFTEAGLIPVQSGGRIKPLDSFAREASLFVTGSRSFRGFQPADLMLSWITFPAEWEKQEFVQIGRGDLKKQLGLPEMRSRFSPQELSKNFALAQYAERAARPAQGKLGPREQELKAVLDRLGLFRNIVSGDAWLVVPRAGGAAWLSLASQEAPGRFIRTQFVELLKSYQNDDREKFEKQSGVVRASIEGEISGWNDGAARTLSVEVTYNRLRPFLWAWIFYLVSSLLWIVSKRFKTAYLALGATALAAGFHVSGIVMRCYVAGRPPVTNMYESVIWVSLGVVAFGAILYWRQRQWITLAVASTLATFGLIAGDAAPAILDPSIRPLVPVLRSNYWLTIHVLTITLGYAAFALTLGLANVSLFHFMRKKATSKAQILSLNQLTYRAMQFGVVLLGAGTILGGVWADYSWGRFWGWDPKEVWALIAFLSYIVLLHARYTGWMGQFGFAAWSVIGFLSVVMAWYGVNFVLGVGLHSYGFSAGGRGWVFSFVAAQLLYVGVAMLIQRGFTLWFGRASRSTR